MNDAIDWHTLFSDSLHFFVSPMHPWASAREALAQGHREGAGGALRLQCSDHAIDHVIAEEARRATRRCAVARQHGEAIKEMVKVGLGVGILAPWVTAREIEAGSLVSVPFPSVWMEREWGVASYAGNKLKLHGGGISRAMQGCDRNDA